VQFIQPIEGATDMADELLDDDIDDVDQRTQDRIDAAMGRQTRHPAAVTIERLQGHADKWADLFTSKELAALSVIVRALSAIEMGER
jgi:hypothetical protein